MSEPSVRKMCNKSGKIKTKRLNRRMKNRAKKFKSKRTKRLMKNRARKFESKRTSLRKFKKRTNRHKFKKRTNRARPLYLGGFLHRDYPNIARSIVHTTDTYTFDGRQGIQTLRHDFQLPIPTEGFFNHVPGGPVFLLPQEEINVDRDGYVVDTHQNIIDYYFNYLLRHYINLENMDNNNNKPETLRNEDNWIFIMRNRFAVYKDYDTSGVPQNKVRAKQQWGFLMGLSIQYLLL